MILGIAGSPDALISLKTSCVEWGEYFAGWGFGNFAFLGLTHGISIRCVDISDEIVAKVMFVWCPGNDLVSVIFQGGDDGLDTS